MKIRASLLLGFLVLAACEPPVPASNPPRGVGFGNLGDLKPLPQGAAPSGQLVSGREIASGVSPQPQQPQNTAPLSAVRPPRSNNPAISDEQDFGAVSSRESIESDAARRAAQQQQFQMVQPTAVPTRQGGGGSAVVDFALSTTHPVGAKVYGRSRLSGQNRFNRNCAQYASGDQAQAAFLAAGGPKRDKMGIDPDGDGYACYWDPRPYRAAVGR